MRSLVLMLLLAACSPADEPVLDDPIVEDEPESEPLHPCDAAAEDQFQAGDPWTPQDKDACFDGCATGEEQGFQQGRLTCITGGERCPECVPDQPDPAYDVGFKACYGEAYELGYADEGCDEP